jgi:succinate-semialdehyde dehydrogenase/glutarate-semialdehyde dehydrogenase
MGGLTTRPMSATPSRPLRSVNPATGRVLRDWPETPPDDVTAWLAESTRASAAWAHAPFPERAEPIRATARLLRERADALARLMAEEMGKPLPQGRAEAQKCASACDHFADHAERFLAPEPAAGSPSGWRELVVFRPLGTVLAIMPWNFPLWQVFRCAAPALMAGSGVVLKHAETTQGCAAAIDDLFRDAGLPKGLFGVLRVGVERIPAIVRHPAVRVVSFTGSTRGGRAVAELAGAALKKTVLELGGSDPYVVLSDADVERAAEVCVTARLINGGQSCISAKRFVVSKPALATFTEHVVERMRSKRWGDPLADETIDLGPLARRDLRDALHAQVQTSVARGARLLLGGAVPDSPGFFYPPSVLADVRPGMPAYDDETFGPVACILPAADDEAAIAIANDTTYGLGAAVFTRDAARGEAIARDRLEAGSCFVNDFVRSDPRLPFGGVKESGWGRELSAWGIREFVYPKTLVVAPE